MASAEPETRPAARPRFRWAIRLTLAVALLAIVGGLFALARFGPETPIGLRMVEQRLDGLRVGRLGRLKVEGLSGDPWARLSVARLAIVDSSGPWLEARGVTLDWRAMELLERRLHIEAVAARRVTVLRRPVQGEAGRPGRPSPISVRIDKANLRLELTPEFAYREGLYDVSGALDVERKGGLEIQIRQTSLLHSGDMLSADLAMDRAKAFVVSADAREAEGGAIGGMLGLPATKSFSLTVRARGALAAGRFRVQSVSGGLTPLWLQGAWNKDGGAANGTLDLGASTLLARYRTMIGPAARFEIAGRKAVDGLYDLTLSASGENVALGARGEADLGKLTTGAKGVAVDLKVGDLTRVTRYPSMGAGQFKGTLSGDQKTWRLIGAASADNLSEAGFSLARIAGPVRIEAKNHELAIEASAAGQGGAGRGLLAALLGAHPSGSARLTVFPHGQLLMRQLTLQGEGLKATATGDRGLFGDLAFKGQASFSNLAMAHAGAKGLVRAAFTAQQRRADAPWVFDADARGEELAAGFGEADRLLGGAPHLRIKASYARDAFTVSEAALDGASGAVAGAGVIGPNEALGLKLTWQARGPFGVGPLEFDGAAKGTGDIAGTFGAPRADLTANFSAINLPELPLRAAHLALTFARMPDGGDGAIHVIADSDYGPANAGATFRLTEHGVELSDANLKAGGADVAGALSLQQGEPSSADITFSLGTGAFLSEGHANGRLKVTGGAAGRQVSLAVKAADLVTRQGGLALRAGSLTAEGPLRRLPYKGHADGATAAGAWRISGDGFLERAGTDRLLTFSGGGRIRRAEIRTRAPAEIRIGDNHRQSAKAALSIGAGRADIDVTRLAGAINGKATLTGVSLALFDEDLVGELSATADVAGHRDQLTGNLEARLTGAGGRDLKGSPPVDGVISARLGGGAMAVKAAFSNTAGLKAAGGVTLPVESSAAPFRIAVDAHKPFSGDFAVEGEIKPLFELLLGGAQSLSGRLSAHGTIAGDLADPRVTGAMGLDDGAFQDGDTGLRLAAVHLRADMADNAIDVSQFTATDGAQGTVAGSGRADLAREGASSFSVDLKGFRLLDNDLARATASGRVTVNRAASGKVQLSGAVTVDKALISPKTSVATGVVPMDVVEVHRPEDVEGRFSPPKESRDAPLGLDVTIKAASGVAVKGRGLNLDLAIDAHVGGTTQTPLLTGKARVVRGDYEFAGQRFQLDDRSVIYLGSTAETIRLDLTATRDDPTLTAVIKIAGTAARPTITLSSTPVLPQDEILSQVLFGASAAQLSGFQAAQLASALAGLSGGGGLDVIGGLRTFAHLDRLAIGGTAATGTTVSGGKYINDRLYLELTGGSREGQGAQLEWRVKKHVSLVSKLGSQGDSQISLRWRKDY